MVGFCPSSVNKVKRVVCMTLLKRPDGTQITRVWVRASSTGYPEFGISGVKTRFEEQSHKDSQYDLRTKVAAENAHFKYHDNSCSTSITLKTSSVPQFQTHC